MAQRTRAKTMHDYFHMRIEPAPSGCWGWSGRLDRDGYAIAQWRGQWKRAARVAYELYVGPIPEGLEIDHLCRNRSCVNPDHLEPVTHTENALRCRTAGPRMIGDERDGRALPKPVRLRCSAITTHNRRCANHAQGDTGLCHYHLDVPVRR